MSDDIVARARAALEGIESLLPWVCDNCPPSTDYTVKARYIDDRGRESWWDLAADNEGSWWSEGNAKFVAQSPELVAELVAKVERVAAERDRLAATVERVWEALDRVVLDHRYTGEPTSPHYQGAADYIRAALDGEGGRDE